MKNQRIAQELRALALGPDRSLVWLLPAARHAVLDALSPYETALDFSFSATEDRRMFLLFVAESLE